MQSVAKPGLTSSTWLKFLALLLFLLSANFVLFVDTWRTMATTWLTTETYQYGIVIPILSVWLIVRRVKNGRLPDPAPSAAGLSLVVVGVFVWALGSVSGITVMQEIAVIGVVVATVIALLGIAVYREIQFPLLYLFCAVPVGESLVPALISSTADFAVAAVNMLGIPVLREGPFIRIPAGDFHVVKACSGIRYLLASTVLGILFARISFRDWRRRIAFLLLAMVVPIVANWVRATMIILLAHASDMRIASGVDHIVYGWIFFGVILFILFQVGRRFSDAGDFQSEVRIYRDAPAPHPLATLVVALAAFGAILAGPALSGAWFSRISSVNASSLELPAFPSTFAGWSRIDTQPAWETHLHGAADIEIGIYSNGEYQVAILRGLFDGGKRESELVNSTHRLFNANRWFVTANEKIDIDLGGTPKPVRYLALGNGQMQKTIMSWYLVDGNSTISSLTAKSLELRSVVAGRGAWGQLIAVSAVAELNRSEDALRAFLGDAGRNSILCPLILPEAPVCPAARLPVVSR